MQQAILAALVISLAAGSGMVFNETSHGALGEWMGVGHHHIADHSGYHCAAHDGPSAAQHLQHMHEARHVPHDDCPGGAPMHGQMPGAGGMMP